MSVIIPVVVIIDAEPSLEVTICRRISEVRQEKASCNNLFVTLAMICAWMDLEVKANLAYTFRSIQGLQRLSEPITVDPLNGSLKTTRVRSRSRGQGVP
jgi:hypothetical protein